MDAVEVRFVPKARALQINGPFGISDSFDEGFPVAAGARWHRYVREHRDRVGGLGHAVEHALRGCGSDTGQQMQKAKPDVLLLAPGPINRGVEITPEVADGPHSAILDQVTNGLAVRMAVLALVCERG